MLALLLAATLSSTNLFPLPDPWETPVVLQDIVELAESCPDHELKFIFVEPTKNSEGGYKFKCAKKHPSIPEELGQRGG